MSFLNIKVVTKKNGQQSAWFRDTLGRRVGTRAGITQDSWVKAEQLAWLANYYIELQQEQLDAAIGSDGQSMPKLSGGSAARFKNRQFANRQYFGYQGAKRKFGGKPIRDLYGPGKDGHMRDDIRINYLDDRQARISITRKTSRDKALANERRAAWWGLSPASAQKFAAAMAGVYGGGVDEYLVGQGLVASSYIVQLARRLNSRSLLRRLAA
jgi:hypothetical protein